MSESSDPGTASSLPVHVEIPGYRLRREIGGDSIGIWFDAEQESLGRQVTLKILKPALESHEGARRRFLAEMDRLAHLDHPNLIRVLDSTREGLLVLVAERIGTRTLASFTAKGEGLPERDAMRKILDVARALHYLNTQGLAHKNVTPSLVAVRGDGSCRLVTFRNVIPLEEQAALKGRLAQDARYVAPEQLAGLDPVGPRAHVYQLGALLFHLIAGVPPHDHGDPKQTAKAHLREPFPSLKRHRPFMDKAVHAFVAACTTRAPAARPSLQRAIEGLQLLVEGKDPGIVPPAARPRPGRIVAPRPRRRKRRRY